MQNGMTMYIFCIFDSYRILHQWKMVSFAEVGERKGLARPSSICRLPDLGLRFDGIGRNQRHHLRVRPSHKYPFCWIIRIALSVSRVQKVEPGAALGVGENSYLGMSFYHIRAQNLAQIIGWLLSWLPSLLTSSMTSRFSSAQFFAPSCISGFSIEVPCVIGGVLDPRLACQDDFDSQDVASHWRRAPGAQQTCNQ